jgi:hypothetical protein
MRRWVWLLALGVLAAALGAASAYAAGTTTTTAATTGTTTTPTATTGTTTAPATTTTPAPTYSRLTPSYLSDACVGAGAAAIAESGRTVLTLGTPATGLGPSSYPTKAPIVRFLYSSASGSGCTSAHVTLGSVSLFGGVVTARSVQATHGRGTVSGFEVYGSPVRLTAGHPVTVDGWGEVTLGKTVGRLTAPLVVQLLQSHHGLPAGTTIEFAFGASPLVVHKSKPKHHSGSTTTQTKPTPASGSGKRTHAKAKAKHPQKKPAVAQPLEAVPSLGFKPRHYVFPVDGGASFVDTYGAGRSDIYDGWHHGDDLFAPLGTPVVAVARGTLSLVGWNELGGWRVWLTDKKGNSFYYAHLAGYASWILTHRHVKPGQVIGFLGRTGDAYTTEPHLHFEIHPHQPAFVKLGYDGAVDPTTYLNKWQVEHVPASEIPRPARLKAPVGTPTQEAAVVWHQLLVARHLLGFKEISSTSTTAPSPALRAPYPHPPSYEASGAPPLKVATGVQTAAHVPATQRDMLLLVGGPLGALVVLSAAATGTFFFRRRRRPAPGAPLH